MVAITSPACAAGNCAMQVMQVTHTRIHGHSHLMKNILLLKSEVLYITAGGMHPCSITAKEAATAWQADSLHGQQH